MMRVARFLTLLRDAAVGWWEDDVPRMSAAVAFYTLFSFAPLVIVAIMIAGAVYGEEAAAGQLNERLEGIVGRTAGEVIEAAIANAHRPEAGVWPTLVSVLISLFAATGVFHELGNALDRVWERAPGHLRVHGRDHGRHHGRDLGAASAETNGSASARAKQFALELLKARFWAFTMVVGIGISLLLSLLASTVLSRLGRHANWIWAEWFWLGRVVDMLLSIGLSTLVFALVYKVLPATKVAWRDLWLGAFIAGILFSVGRLLIGSYLAHSTVASVYGAAGALVVVMVWTWCSAMVLLFGAEFCQAYARRHGRLIGRKQAGRRDSSEGLRELPVMNR
jgi:membrane protein